MPDKNTFKIKPINSLLFRYLIGLHENAVVVDPFANKGTIKKIVPRNDITYITNDLDERYNTDFHLDALDFLKSLDDKSVDFLVWDPPFSPRQVSECYKALEHTVDTQTTQSSYWTNQKQEISRILKPRGIVVTTSWNSGGIGKKYGFDIQEILLVPHGGWHNDTIVVVEKKEAHPAQLSFLRR